MTVQATDLEISLTTSVAVTDGEDGAAAVPGKQFCEYVRAMPGASVSLNLEEGAMFIKSGRSRYKLQFYAAAEEFPVLPTVEPKQRFTIAEQTLAETLRRTLIAAANDDTRPVLCGVLWRREKGTDRLVMVATDTHRLHLASCDIENAEGAGDVILSNRTCGELIRLLSGDQDCTVTIDDNQVHLDTAAGTLTGRLLEGKFPVYDKIIPTYSKHLGMNRDDLAEILKRAAVVASDDSNRLILEFGPDKTNRITARSSYGEAEEEFMVEGLLQNGQDPKLAANYKLLLEAVQACPDEGVRFLHEGGQRPVLIHGLKRDNFLAVVMPMSMQ